MAIDLKGFDRQIEVIHDDQFKDAVAVDVSDCGHDVAFKFCVERLRPAGQGIAFCVPNGDLAEFVALQKGVADSEKSWSVDVADIDQSTWDLSVKNPTRNDEVVLREPRAIIDAMMRLDTESAKILKGIRGLV